MTWFAADYLIFSASVIAGVGGLFIGFSGALAFLAATALGVLAGKLAWAFGGDYFVANWSRGLATLVISILAFGLVRWAVKRSVNGLLKQPADGIFGFLISAGTGFVICFIAVYLLNFFNIADVRSTVVTEVMDLV